MLIHWTDEQTDDAIIGSGALEYEWWVSADPIDGGYALSAYIDVDKNKWMRVQNVSFAKMRRITQEIGWGKHNVRQEIVDMVKNDDLDADAADCVLQLCMFGTIIYG